MGATTVVGPGRSDGASTISARAKRIVAVAVAIAVLVVVSFFISRATVTHHVGVITPASAPQPQLRGERGNISLSQANAASCRVGQPC